jgi:hypothetical protein
MTTTDHTAARHEREAREEIRRRLLGAWQLVSYTATSIDGKVIHPLGPTPHGLIVYTPQGYGGPFEVVDPATVEHHVTTSLFPNWIGRSQVRTVTFEGALLKLGLATPTRLWGAERTAELTWSRPA